ncbi:MAG: hypothetical protein Q9200_007374 [Gallowayella weberi]
MDTDPHSARTQHAVATVRTKSVSRLPAPAKNMVRKEQKTKARERIEAAPRYWAEPTKSVSISPGPSSASIASATPTPAGNALLQNVETTAGVKRPLKPMHSGKSNARIARSGAIGKKSSKQQKKISPTQAIIALQAADRNGNKENELIDEDRDELMDEGSDLARSSAASGEPFKRVTRKHTRTAPIEIHEDHE